MRERFGKIATVTFLAGGILRAATAAPPPDGKPITDPVAREAYRDVVSRERSMRHEAALKFPGDAWSADDDFHEREQSQARAFASSNETRLVDVLGAIDDGMRAGWPPAVHPDPKVPPCRPRLSY